VENLIKQHFGSIPKPANAKPRKKYGIPAQKETQTVILTDPEQPYNVVQIFYKQPEIPEAKTDLEYRASIVRGLFNNMMSARLQEIAQKPDAPFLFGSSSYDRFLGDKDALTLVAVAKDGTAVAKASQTLLEENERVRQHGFTQGELDRAKSSMLTYIENAYTERDKTRSADYVGELIRNFLHGETIPGIEVEYDLYRRFMPAIKLSEVNSLITQWIKPTDRAVVVMAPESEKDKLITQSQMLALVNKPVGKLQPYEDKVMKGALLAKEPVAGKIVDEKKITEIGVTELTLSNGARVVLKPTNFKNNEIRISAVSKGGSSLYKDEDYLSASNASSIALYGGVGNFDIQSLQKELSGKQVSITPTIGQYTEGLSGSSSVKDLPVAFQLIHGYFTQARKDTNMFKVLQQQLYTSLANKGKDPGSVFGDSISYIMSNYNIRRKPLTIDRLSEISLDKAFEMYQDRFADAGDFIFTFVGSFKVDSIKPFIEKYIASLPSSGRKETWKDVGIRYPTGVVNRVIKKGQESKSSVRLTFTGMTVYNELEAIQLDQVAKVLEIRLREVLREDQGGVYGVGVDANINREPVNSYAITISFSCAPENVDKLVNFVMDEIKSLKEKGAAQTNIEKVIAEDTRALETSVTNNNYWLYNLQQKYYNNEDPKTILENASLARKLTVARTKELAEKYFDMNNVAKLILMPQDK
jgi:zinc protease